MLNFKLPMAYLTITAFVCGTLIMVIEVLGSRVIGPFFGVSLFVWSSLIAVAMIALAAGYALGGILSDRRDHPDYLYGIILVAGLLVLLIPFLSAPVLKASMPLGFRVGAFVSSLTLFGPPLLLLGFVSPYIIRIAAREMKNIGRTVGSFYALSTIGSVVGTLLTGFVLIVYIGVNQIFFLVGTLLILLAVFYFVYFRRKWPLLALLLLPAVALAWTGQKTTRLTLPSGTVATVVYAKDTYYGSMKIVDYKYGANHTREMLFDGVIQTGVDMKNLLSIYPYPYILSILPYSLNPEGKRCLVVGLGGGAVPAWYEARGIKTDVVDIDPEVIRLAKDYFNFQAQGITAVEDARYFLGKGTDRYDYIVMDIFSGEAAPAHVISLEALQLVRNRLADDGVLAINFAGRLGGDDLMTGSVVKTLKQVFNNVEIYPFVNFAEEEKIGNLELIAYNGPTKHLPADLISRFEIHPFAVEDVRKAYQQKLVLPEDQSGFVLTDNYNPIDCYDNKVKEVIRKNVIESTDWRILIGSM
ncbi:MAG: fused MFS/spermidine synthase [Desulfuromonadales bacterium]|nr:fused MFS/spermidine synthase [Desulfuromonadales bacterium]